MSRTLKETWLFGKLRTVGTSEAEKRTEVAKKLVAEVLEQRRHNQSDEAHNGAGDSGIDRIGSNARHESHVLDDDALDAMDEG